MGDWVRSRPTFNAENGRGRGRPSGADLTHARNLAAVNHAAYLAAQAAEEGARKVLPSTAAPRQRRARMHARSLGAISCRVAACASDSMCVTPCACKAYRRADTLTRDLDPDRHAHAHITTLTLTLPNTTAV